MNIKLPQRAWYQDDEVEISFPASWEVQVLRMRGHDAPAVTGAQIAKSLQNPIGTKPLRELARGKKEVAIAFDDLSRPTRSALIVPYVLEELKAADIPDGNIRFISALGAHSAMDGAGYRKKLGAEVLDRFAVYNHNCYDNCTYVGKTSRGTPISINSEFMSCDLRLGIGSILPHPRMGFGGGGKIVLPGLAHMDTILANHSLPRGSTAYMGNIAGNQIAEDIAEAAKLAGLDFKVDVLINHRLETTALFAGDPLLVHQEGVKLAKGHYATEAVTGADIVVVNTYAKANECVIAMAVASPLLEGQGGDLVLITNTPEGQVIHYLMGYFGKHHSGSRFPVIMKSFPPGVKRMTILAPYVDRAGERWFGTPGSITWKKTWDEVRGMLEETYDKRAKVAVIPDGTMQYFPALRSFQTKNEPQRCCS
ncbi:MAG: lactate racemase domain-containing protein [Chloroflexota bacterium]